MGVHIQPSPMPYQASRRGGRSRHGRTLRNGIAGPAAVVQPQRRQRQAESLARTWKRCLRAQAPRCRCARAARHRPPPSGGQDPPPRTRLERHAANPSIVVPGRARVGSLDGRWHPFSLGHVHRNLAGRHPHKGGPPWGRAARTYRPPGRSRRDSPPPGPPGRAAQLRASDTAPAVRRYGPELRSIPACAGETSGWRWGDGIG